MAARAGEAVRTGARYCGLGLLWGWMNCFGACLGAARVSAGAPGWLPRAFALGLAAAYLGLALFFGRFGSSRAAVGSVRLMGRPAGALAAGCAASLLCLGAAVARGALSSAALAAGTGACTAVLMLGWARALGRVDPDWLDAVVLVNVAVSALTGLVSPAVPAVALWYLTLTPAAVGCLLASTGAGGREGRPGAAPPMAAGLGAARPGPLMPAATCLLVYLVFEFLAAGASQEGAAGYNASSGAVTGALTAVLAFVFLRFSPRVDPEGVSIALLATALVALALRATAPGASLVVAAVNTGVVVVLLSFFAYREDSPRAAASMALVLGFLEAGGLLGQLLAWRFGAGAAADVVGALAVGTACLLIPMALRPGRPGPQAAGAEEGGLREPDDPVAAACSELARRRDLSPREAEVLEMLARGRSRPYIRDALGISTNTVASHTAHIYEKLGVHSKQELISLIEGMVE